MWTLALIYLVINLQVIIVFRLDLCNPIFQGLVVFQFGDEGWQEEGLILKSRTVDMFKSLPLGNENQTMLSNLEVDPRGMDATTCYKNNVLPKAKRNRVLR